MIQEKIKNIYSPLNDDEWFLIETDLSSCLLKLGGYRLKKDFSKNKYSLWHSFKEDVTIEKVYTDDEWLYIMLSNKTILIHGWGSIDSAGEVSAEIKIMNISEFYTKYGSDFFNDSLIQELESNESGDSIFKS